jgi:hypothetical protein
VYHRPRRLRSIASTPFDPTPMTLRRVELWSAGFDSCWPHASDINLFAYHNQTLGSSTMTSPLMIHGTTSARLHCHGDSATMRLHRHDDSAAVLTSFCVLPHDMQDYDFKARFESLPGSTTRLDTQGLLTRTRPIGSSCLAYLVLAKEEAHSRNS